MTPESKAEGQAPEAEALASSLVDVLSAENADLKAKLESLQNLYDDAAQDDMMRVSREEALKESIREAAFRAGFLAGTSFGMDQGEGISFNNPNIIAPDENEAWADYRDRQPVAGADAGKDAP